MEAMGEWKKSWLKVKRMDGNGTGLGSSADTYMAKVLA